MSDSVWLYGLWPARLFCPWGFSRQEKNTGVGRHAFLQGILLAIFKKITALWRHNCIHKIHHFKVYFQWFWYILHCAVVPKSDFRKLSSFPPKRPQAAMAPSSPPQPLAPTSLLHVSADWPFWAFHRNGIMHYVAICIGPLSPSRMSQCLSAVQHVENFIPGLLHCRQILHCLSHQESPLFLFVVA